ncbi:MAG TPA: hypothetical protein VFH77_08505 [Streptomyces sp.]|nr:hypothetical protein [Streptomyces sp.]
MAASAELLTALAEIPKQGHEPVDPSGVLDPDAGLDGSCSCGCAESPLTSEPPLADVAPLTSEPPIAAELPLTSEPTGTGFGTEFPGI